MDNILDCVENIETFEGNQDADRLVSLHLCSQFTVVELPATILFTVFMVTL